MKSHFVLALMLFTSFDGLSQVVQPKAVDTLSLSDTSLKKSSLMPTIEIQGVRAEQKYPFTQSMIYKSNIAKNNLGQDIPFLLNQVPGAVASSDAGNGIGYTGIRIRGTDPNRINFTINGISYNDAESQGVFLVNMPDLLSSTNSMQIQRGVGTSTNGSGAFGATVNILTNEVQEKAYTEINNSVGSFNTFKHTFKAGTGLINNRFTVDVRLSSIKSDGYIERASSDLKSFYISAASIKENSSLRFNIISGKEKTYQAWYGVSEEQMKINRRFNEAGMRPGADPYDNETDNYWQTHYQLFYNKKINTKWNLNNTVFTTTGRGHYEQYKTNEKFEKYGLPSPIINGNTIKSTDLVRQLWLDNIFIGNNISVRHKNEKREVTLGGNMSNYLGDHFGKIIWSKYAISKDYKWYDLNANKSEQSVFGKWMEESGNFQFFGDVQLRNIQYDINGFRNNPTLNIKQQWTFFNPKAGIRYTKEKTSTYLSFARATKEPNRDDFEAGNMEIPRPERLDDWEAGIQHTSKKYRYSITFYYMNYKDQLVLTGRINDVGAYTRTNIAKSFRRGIELEGSYSFNPWLQLTSNLALSQNKIQSFTEYYDDYDNGGQKTNLFTSTNIAFSPAVVNNTILSASIMKKTELRWIAKYVSRQYLDNTSRKDRSLDPYLVNDLQINRTFSLKNGTAVSTVIQVNNLFNKRYAPNGYTYSYYYGGNIINNNYFYPMAERNWMIGLNISL
ncbi:MAG: TonB-dependent receptor [Bacteroidetes bacterium]|nr:TonB-dependent receptor [Bacteroidota bacterium]